MKINTTKHLDSYMEIMENESPEAVDSIRKTVNKVAPEHIESFNHKEHVKGLLLGQVQSGKTGQMLGLVAAAADIDPGFTVFVLLTSDITALQQQTYKRALTSMDTFNVCGENDEMRFRQIGARKPALIVLKKNSLILKKWRNILVSSGLCEGRPIFVVDDEADAASLNTQINKKEQSTINKHLQDILDICTSSFYLQVTATPQSLLLQTERSGWKPSFVHYFPPGNKYLGGEFFYSKPKPYTNITTDDDELSILIETDDTPDGLKHAIDTYLLTAAHISLGAKPIVCNFLVHPSVRINVHEKIKSKVVTYLDHLFENLEDKGIRKKLQIAWEKLNDTKPEIESLSELIAFLETKPDIKVITLNSGPDGTSKSNSDEGLNIIIGGNSLGRGVTFKGLQTVYYCRSSKSPQADTFWQHCRMFGYDRDRSLVRVFMPLALYHMFSEINASNEMLIQQIQSGKFDDIQIILNKKIRPTRRNVIDLSSYSYIIGGVNYFPAIPEQGTVAKMDQLLENFDERPMNDVSIKNAVRILKALKDDPNNNWSTKTFINALEAINTHKGTPNLVKLIVRRNRKISSGKRTLLSPEDRRLGSEIDNLPVITLYRLEGKTKQGWQGEPFWIPNIKLPTDKVFHRSE